MNLFLKLFIEQTFKRPGAALDLGAGDYKDAKFLQSLGWKAKGVDIKDRVDLNFVYLDDDRPFDLVYSNYVLHKIENQENFIETISENLKENGYFFIHTIIDNISKKKQLEIINEPLKKNNLKLIKSLVRKIYDDDPGHHHWHTILELIGQKNQNKIAQDFNTPGLLINHNQQSGSSAK